MKELLMKRIDLLTGLILILTTAVSVDSQTQRRTTRQPQTETRAQRLQMAKPAKILVQTLPSELKGIELKDGLFRLKPGYKFVRESKNTITVTLDNGSPIGMSLKCKCDLPEGTIRPGGACIAEIYDDDGWEAFYCRSDPWDECNVDCLGYGQTGKPSVALANFGRTQLSFAATDSQPKSVPGSINRGNGAVIKPGYIFVRRGNEVDVMRADGRLKMGTYVCTCRSGDANQKCELQFSPEQILCRQGSCTGATCRLVPVEPAAAQ
jgi:hypothetical protein